MDPLKTNKNKRRRFWKKAWPGVLLVVAALAAAAWYLTGGTFNLLTSAQAKTTVDYKTSAVKTGSLRISIASTANLIAAHTVDLNFSTGGKVTAVNVKLGDEVKAGTVLAKVDGADSLEAKIASYQLQALQAEKELKDMQKKAGVALAEAYQAWVSAQQVYNDAVFAVERMAYARCSKEVNVRNAGLVDQAKSRLDDLSAKAYGSDAWIAARAAYDTAQANYTYCAAYTDAEKAEAQASQNLAESKMKSAEATYLTLKNGARGVAGIDPDTLNLAEAKLKEAQLQLASAKKDLEGITLIAPIDGKVTYLAAGTGSITGTNKFITLSDLKQPTVEVYIDEKNISQFVIGYQAEVKFDALPNQSFMGKLTQIEPELVSSSQSALVKGTIELDSAAAKSLAALPLGANGSAEIISKESRNTLLVPVEAVRELGDGSFGVFVLSSSGSLTFKPVEVGLMNSTSAEIISGLTTGDVITTGTVPTSK